MLRKTILAALFVILPATAGAQSAFPDLRDYQSLLDQYISRIGAKGEPLDTRFDYEQLYVDEKIWTLKRSARLEKLHAQLLGARPSEMTPAERLAWGINTYNFLVIERVTANLILPPSKNRRFSFQRYASVDQIVQKGSGFFQTNLAEVEGRPYTLNGFERRFVFGDTTSELAPRSPLADPRLRFATCPGRIGAPLLQPRAFRPDSLERQLDHALKATLALPRFVTVTRKPPMLLVSDWLARAEGDLGGSTAAMLEFVLKHAPRAIRDGMKQANLTGVSRYTTANPLLNQKDHPKLVMPPTTGEDTVAP